MWFMLSIGALIMLVTRRTTEKHLSSTIDPSHLAWLQQLFGMPFILLTLLIARFYWPHDLSGHFWQLMIIYTVCYCIDVWCYFKALSLADISYVAPLLSLVAIGNSVGAFFVLGQPLTLWGIVGGACIIMGAYLVNRAKQQSVTQHKNNRIALLIILVLVVIRSYYSNIEVPMLQESNVTTFNFYTSLFAIPVLFTAAVLIHRSKPSTISLKRTIRDAIHNVWPLIIIGVTYTINLLATFQAKLLSPNAGYVGAVKSASVLPMVIVGMVFFHEKFMRMQWIGLGVICIGLFCIGMN